MYVPVSYTHLDVYKRQEYASIRSIIEPVTSPKVNPVEERKSQPVQDITNPVQQELPLNQPTSVSADTAPKETATKTPDYLVLQYSKKDVYKRQIRDFGYEYVFEGIKESPNHYDYRNKMEFSFGDEVKDGPLALGMHKRGSFYDIVTVDGCRLTDGDFRCV